MSVTLEVFHRDVLFYMIDRVNTEVLFEDLSKAFPTVHADSKIKSADFWVMFIKTLSYFAPNNCKWELTTKGVKVRTNLERITDFKWIYLERMFCNSNIGKSLDPQPITVEFPTELKYLLNLIHPSMSFGVELEVISAISPRSTVAFLEQFHWTSRIRNIASDGCCHGNATSWNIQHDASVIPANPEHYGFEIATPVLRGKEGLLTLFKMLHVLRTSGYFNVNKTCGTHIHLGGFQKSKDIVNKIILSYKKCETLLDSLVSRSRREKNNIRYCDSIVGKTYQDIMDGKYLKISFRKISSNGTFENRQHQGTIDFEKIATWVILNQVIPQYAITTGRFLCENNIKRFLEVGLGVRLKKSSVAHAVPQLVSYLNRRYSLLNSEKLLPLNIPPQYTQGNFSIVRTPRGFVTPSGHVCDSYHSAETRVRRENPLPSRDN